MKEGALQTPSGHHSAAHRTQQCRLQNRRGSRDSQSKGIESEVLRDATYPWTFTKVNMWEQRVVATGAGGGEAAALWAECGGPSPAALGAAEVLRGLSVLPHAETHGSQLGQGRGPSTLSCSRPLGPSLEGLASSL